MLIWFTIFQKDFTLSIAKQGSISEKIQKDQKVVISSVVEGDTTHTLSRLQRSAGNIC